MSVKVELDTTHALAKMHAVPMAVRNNLRRVLPGLTKKLGDRVDQKLDTQLKSRNRLQTRRELVETATTIYGRTSVQWTGDPAKHFIPQILETGARAHPIEAVNAQALSFFWDKLGMQVAFKRVWHPGFPGIHYMQNAFQELEGEILETIKKAATKDLRATG